MASPAAERVTYLVGGAALGAVSYAAYLKFAQKPKPAAISQPVPVAPRPVPGPAGGPQRSLDKIENAKTILPFGFPGKRLFSFHSEL